MIHQRICVLTPTANPIRHRAIRLQNDQIIRIQRLIQRPIAIAQLGTLIPSIGTEEDTFREGGDGAKVYRAEKNVRMEQHAHTLRK